MIFKKNMRKNVNVEYGKDGFQRTNWDKNDLERLQDIKKQMELYKSKKNSEWKWIAHLTQKG